MPQLPTIPAGVANRARELYYSTIVFMEPHGANTKSVLDDLADDAYRRTYPDATPKIAPGDKAAIEAWFRLRADVEALAINSAKPNADFDPNGVTWPLETPPTGSKAGGKFAASRPWGKPQTRFHTGIDLAARDGAAVLAPESGVVVAPNSGWEMKKVNGVWRGVKALLLKTDSGRTWLLGGIRPNSALVKAGERVVAGQKLAFIGPYPGGSTMLHISLYDAGLTEPQVNAQKSWALGGKKPKNLIDPAPFLNAAKKNTVQTAALVMAPVDDEVDEEAEVDEGSPEAAGPGSDTAVAPAPTSGGGKAGGVIAGVLATLLIIVGVKGK